MNECNNGCENCLFKAILSDYVTEEEFKAFREGTTIKRFKKGSDIFEQEDNSPYVVYLRSGMVKFIHHDPNGTNSILTVVKAPTFLGLANVLNDDVNVFSITIVEDGEGCLISLDNLKLLAMSNPLFMMRVMKMSTDLFRQSILTFIKLAHKRVFGRIASILLYLSKEIYQSDCFKLSLTRKELAEYAGCSKENVINTLSKLHKDRIIWVENKQITIIDFDRLESISRLG